MLQHLYIQNFALISHLDIDLYPGFSVLTGETGAGKSIILGALGLILGERADSRTITEGEHRCVIEATFTLELDNTRHVVRQILSQNDIDNDDTLILRRELTDNGRSRAFINDTPVQLSTLRQAASVLIDIHSQHQNLLLRDSDFQLSVVDTIAQNQTLLNQYRQTFNNYKEQQRRLEQLQQADLKAREEADYLQFQYDQLKNANLQDGELEDIEAEHMQLTHAEDIKRALFEAANLLSEESTQASVKEAIAQLRQASRYSDKSQLIERLESLYIELKDIHNETQRDADDIDYDPERLQIVEERLDTLNSLLLKHHKQTIAELIELRDSLQQQLLSQSKLADEIQQLQKQIAQLHAELDTLATQLTTRRLDVREQICQQLLQRLEQLGMRNANVDISITTTELNENGHDLLQFLFAGNKNQTLRPIAQVASGGEIARLMLSLKSLTAQQLALETIIFDEIDTGVSGEVASNMGNIMRQMAQSRQIITITHLPQIAAKGQHHYKVYKQDNEQRTETHMTLLGQEQRTDEIATLLSGQDITQAARDNAKALLMNH